MNVSIIHADESHLDALAPLFDQYRSFYGQSTDIAGASRFLSARLTSQDSTILLAMKGTEGVGFTQLYPSFSSVAMQPIFILNDLFIIPTARKMGVGQRLLDAAAEFAKSASAARLVLATATDNHQAQSLYKKNGWQLDREFDHYALPLNNG